MTEPNYAGRGTIMTLYRLKHGFECHTEYSGTGGAFDVLRNQAIKRDYSHNPCIAQSACSCM